MRSPYLVPIPPANKAHQYQPTSEGWILNKRFRGSKHKGATPGAFGKVMDRNWRASQTEAAPVEVVSQ